jgi:hypothetical protein
LCIRELEKLDLSPVDRIQIYQRFKLDDALLLDCFETLTTREEPIGFEEGAKLGLKTSLHIARAREYSRSPDTGGPRSPAVQLKSPDLRLLISNIFQFPPVGPFTAPVNDSNKVDRASALPAVSDANFSLLRVPVIVAITFVDGPHDTIKTRSSLAEQLHLRRSPPIK